MTVVSLQPGEELVTVAAGDTVRWIVGDTSSGGGPICASMCWSLHPLRSENQSRHHHQSAHLPAGADLDREGMDGVGVLGLSERPNARVAAPGAGSAGNNARRYGPVAGQDPLRYAVSGSNRRGSLCAPSMMERRSISSSAGHRPGRAAAAVCHRRAGRRATGELPFSLAVLRRGIACSARPNCGWAAMAATWCGSSAPMVLHGGTDHEPG